MDHQDDLAQKQAALLQHQASIQAAASVLQSLQNTLSQQENALAALLAEKPDLEPLNRQYEDALAETVTGDGDDTTLVSISTILEAAKTKLTELEPEIGICRKTIAGLRRKIAEQEQAINILQKKAPGLLREWLHAESNSVAESYINKAKALLEDHHRLEGLFWLLGHLGHPPGPATGGLLVLPAYELPAFEGNRFIHDRKCLFKGPIEWSGRRAADQAAIEENRIASLGVDFHKILEARK